MSKIAIIGTGPLQEEGVCVFSGQCLRTWHFTRPLLEAGHEIHLITHPINDRSFNRYTDPVCRPAKYKGLKYQSLQTNTETLILREVERQLKMFRPDAILGINPFPAALACRQRYRAPVWADMNGYVLAEGQTHCHLHRSDERLEHFWRMEKEVVRRADRISTVSRIQRHATLGELALMGRLNRFTRNHPFVTFIPNAVSERYARFTPPTPHLRGQTIPQNSFMLLWSGGFNTWTDIDTLFTALESLMKDHTELHFVSTGGVIAGHDEKTYVRFQQMVQKSSYVERYHLLGWVEAEVVDALYGESDLGINIDSENYETLFGARNRLTNMMACGLPVMTTRGTEFSQDIETARTGLVTPIGDVALMIESIREALSNPTKLKRIGRKGRKWVLETFSYEATTREILEWLEDPAWAPDNVERLRKDRPHLPLDRLPLHSLDELLRVCNRASYTRLIQDQRDLTAIRHKPVWRVAKKLKTLFRNARKVSRNI